MSDSEKKISEKSGAYMYRPRGVYANGLPLSKRIIQRAEKLNKFFFLRVLGKILRIRPLHGKLDLDKLSSVLFIRYDALGDMVVTTPLWRKLKRLKPGIKIGVAGSSKNLGIIAADPDIDITYDYSASSLMDFLSITKKTREEKWDLVVMCKFNQKTRGGFISRLSTTNGYNVTVGTPNAEGHQALFSKLVSLPKPQNEMPMTEQLQYLLQSVIALPEEKMERPSIAIDSMTLTNVQKKIRSLLDGQPEKYIVINCDAPAVRKWPMEKNAALAKFIEDEIPDYSILLTSLPENKHETEHAIKSLGLTRTWYFDADNLLELVALIHYSNVVITPDTAIAHIASAEEKPIVGLYPEAGEWLPYKVNSYIILPKKGQPIASIPFEMVKKATQELLSNKGDNDIIHIIRCD